MHRLGIALIPAHYGNLQEDYHSVTANPSFGCHGDMVPLHGSLRPTGRKAVLISNYRHGLVFPGQNDGRASLFNECI